MTKPKPKAKIKRVSLNPRKPTVPHLFWVFTAPRDPYWQDWDDFRTAELKRYTRVEHRDESVGQNKVKYREKRKVYPKAYQWRRNTRILAWGGWIILLIAAILTYTLGHSDRAGTILLTCATVWWPLFRIPGYVYVNYRYRQFHQDRVGQARAIQVEKDRYALKQEQDRTANMVNYEMLSENSASEKRMVGRKVQPDKDSVQVFAWCFIPRIVRTKSGYRFADDPNNKIPGIGGTSLAILFTKKERDIREINDARWITKDIWDEQTDPKYMVYFQELPKKDCPPEILRDYLKNPQMADVIVGLQVAHGNTIGATGSGKTASAVVWDLVLMLNSQKRPSILINSKQDAKEFAMIYPLVALNGYRVLNYDLSSPTTSDSFNPLSPIWVGFFNAWCLDEDHDSQGGLRYQRQMDGVSLAEYNQSLFFTIKNSYFKTGRVVTFFDGTGGNEAYKYKRIMWRSDPTHSLMWNARDVLDEIVVQSRDPQLYQIMDEAIAQANAQLHRTDTLDTIDTRTFIRLFLATYQSPAVWRKYGKRNYTIGQIAYNFAMPYTVNKGANVFIDIDQPEAERGYNRRKRWYLCGMTAFADRESFENEREIAMRTISDDTAVGMSNIFRQLKSSDTTSGADFWETSGQAYFEMFVKAFKLGMDGHDPEFFAEEYFTVHNINRNAELIEKGTTYGEEVADPKAHAFFVDIRKELCIQHNQDPKAGGKLANNPLTKLVTIANGMGMQNINGNFNPSIVEVDETFKCIQASYQALFGDIMQDATFSLTYKTDCYADYFYLNPCYFNTTIKGSIKDKLNRLITILFMDLRNGFRTMSADYGKSPRPVVNLIDEFGQVLLDAGEISQILTQGRAQDVYLQTVSQDLNQIKNVYPNSDVLNNLETNSSISKVLMEDTTEVATQVSEMLGKYPTVEVETDPNKKSDFRHVEKPFFTPTQVKNQTLYHIMYRVKLGQSKKTGESWMRPYYLTKTYAMMRKIARDYNLAPVKITINPERANYYFDFLTLLFKDYRQMLEQKGVGAEELRRQLAVQEQAGQQQIAENPGNLGAQAMGRGSMEGQNIQTVNQFATQTAQNNPNPPGNHPFNGLLTDEARGTGFVDERYGNVPAKKINDVGNQIIAEDDEAARKRGGVNDVIGKDDDAVVRDIPTPDDDPFDNAQNDADAPYPVGDDDFDV